MTNTSKLVLILSILTLIFIPSWAIAACVANANYDCVTCTQGETGSCRQPKDLTLPKVRAAVNDSAASNGTKYGDGVYLISGTQTWTSGITMKKGLVLKGAGSANTKIITSNITAVLFTAASHCRITGINFISYGTYYLISGYGTEIRIDHNLFSGAYTMAIAWLDGHHNTGLVDSNTFSGDMGGGVAVWVNDVGGYITSNIDFGSRDWVFVEGNTFNSPSNGAELVENQNLGKIVNRYNTYNELSPSNMQTVFEQHNTSQGSGGRAQEVYNNRVNFNSAKGWIRMLYWRHGTGLVHNNLVDYSRRRSEPAVYFQLRAYRAAGGVNHDDFSDKSDCANWGTDTADNAAGSALCAGCMAKCCSTSYTSGRYTGEGYPCIGQPGQGVYGRHEPIYFWDNKKTADGTTLVNLTSSNVLVAETEKWAVALNTDYCVSTAGRPTSCGGHVLSYTPYTCPHPLAGTGSCNNAVAGTAGYVLDSSK